MQSTGFPQDVRYALRGFRRSPLFAAIAIATLAIGIGASAAIFSVAYGLLVRPLPYPESERLVFMTERSPTGGRMSLSWPSFQDWQKSAQSCEAIAGFRTSNWTLTGRESAKNVESRAVSWTFFLILRAQPLHGRLFSAEDEKPGATPTAVLSYAGWQREFAGDPGIIGTSLTLNNRAFTIIGVLPETFSFLAPMDLYTPLALQGHGNSGWQNRGNHFGINAIGRLRSGIDIRQAQSEVETLAAALGRHYPDTNSGIGAQLIPLHVRAVERLRPVVLVLTGAVALLLLIACVNLANLLIARGATREQELAIRTALGGSRWRLVRQLLVEHALLIAAGGLLGLVVAVVVLRVLLGLVPQTLPRLQEIRLSPALLGWGVLAATLCTTIAGLIPALRASRLRVASSVSRGSRQVGASTSRLRFGLIAVELAVATVLLAGAGLMVRTMTSLTHFNPGFDPRNLLTMYFDVKGPAWGRPRRLTFFDEAVARLEALPDVERAALTYSLPIDGSNWGSIFILDDRAVPPRANLPSAAFIPISSGYFATMKTPLRRGRGFDRRETPTSPPVAVINETMARRLWPDGDPIGKQIKQGWPEDNTPWREIVGVVADTKLEGVNADTPMQIYLPLAHEAGASLVAIVRARVDPMRVASSAQQAIRSFDRDIPIQQIRPMTGVMSEAIWQQRGAATILTAFSVIALLLSAIGLYGIVAHHVIARRPEIGLRLALGATHRQVLGLFLRQGAVMSAIGLTLGVAAVLMLGRWIESLLFQVSATDIATLAATVGALGGVALIATYLPARRATRVDPLTVLKGD